MKKLLILFATFFKIGLFTFGGGYAMLSLIQSETVTKKHWLDGDELLDIIAISESTPGPISINCATYIGYKRAGFLGSLIATLGVVLPSFIIIFVISFFIEDFLKIELIGKAFKGIQACVAVLILRAAVKMIKNIKKDAVSLIILLAALVVTITLNFVAFDLSSIYLIILGGFVGFIYYGIISKREKKTKAKVLDGSDPATVSSLHNDDVGAEQKLNNGCEDKGEEQK